MRSKIFICDAIPKRAGGEGGLSRQFGLFLKRNAKYLYLYLIPACNTWKYRSEAEDETSGSLLDEVITLSNAHRLL